MTPPAPRVLPGPFSSRVCGKGTEGFVWVEELRGGTDPRAEELLDAARRVMSSLGDPVLGALPRPLSRTAFVSPPVSSCGLLFDSFIRHDVRAGVLEAASAEVGSFLGRFHVAGEGSAPHLPAHPASPVPPWRSHDHALVQALADIYDALADDGNAAPLLAAAAALGDAAVPDTVVHGGLSLGWIALDPTEPLQPTVMGWLQTAYGDPLVDVGAVVGQIAEVAAAGFVAPNAAARIATAFVSGYAAEAPSYVAGRASALRAWAARQILHHMTIRRWASAAEGDTGVVLSRAGDVLDSFVGAFDLGERVGA